MRLSHLTAVGPDVAPAGLDFDPKLTVVYGASEAGKSYIAEAIDYMFGSSTLRDIPEADGYKEMLLGIDIGTRILTLARALRNGNRMYVYDGDVRTFQPRSPDAVLAVASQARSAETLSHFLLERLGLADSKVRINSRNDTVALGFRDISRLAIVDEERMHSRTSPVESGRFQTRTKELSVLKLLLEGHDDSGLIGGDDPTAFRRLNRAQLSVLERAIAQAHQQVADAPSERECLEGLESIERAITSHTAAIAEQIEARDEMTARLQALVNARSEIVSRSREAEVLTARFQLLDEQYGRDLDRLETVRSAGSLLRYFDAERCVYCGALAADQHPKHAEYETTKLREAIDAEMGQTTALQSDLRRTIADLAAQRAAAESEAAAVERDVLAEEERIAELDRNTGPDRAALEELLARKHDLERWAQTWRHIGELLSLSRQVAKETPTTSETTAQSISYIAEDGLSGHLRSVLSAWGVPAGEDARFVAAPRPDIIIGGRPRADRGEGMRSVLHAGFSTALAEYCAQRDLPHPGFLVLDTPMLTYRDPELTQGVTSTGPGEEESPEAAVGEDVMPVTVARAFYAYLATSTAQAIVLENQTPPVDEGPGCKLVYFSGNEAVGRPGFYPSASPE